MKRTALTSLIVLILIATPSALRADEPVSLERTLVRAAPLVLKHCRDQGYHNVGVLKFQIYKEGEKKLTDNAGTLNRTIARQLELGLVLINDPLKPLGIIEEASEIAARTPGANHLKKDARLKLFEPDYPLAWGKERVKADAFVTGVVEISSDLKTLAIQLVTFDKQSNELKLLGPRFQATNDARKLSEMGESFSTRGAFDNGKTELKAEAARKEETAILETAAKLHEKGAKHPVEDTQAPVRLEVLYDGKPIPFEVHDGKAFVPDPKPGQRVFFRLKRGTGKGTLACVLKVNGENTLFREKLPDLQCRKWLLLPDNTQGLDVMGFQKNDQTIEEFRVLSRAESKAKEIDYGADVGTITLTVFRERQGKSPAGDLSDETQNTNALEQAKRREKKPDNLGALMAQLLADGNRSSHLIGVGDDKPDAIRILKFDPEPAPIMSITAIYYKQ
jgi:hypothetical protein